MNRRLASLFVIAISAILCISAAGQERGLSKPPEQVAPVRVPPPPADATPQQLIEKGDLLNAQKAYLDAIDYYRAALKKQNFRSAVTWNKIGMTQLQIQRFKDAEKSFKHSIKLDKQYADAVNNLGVVYYLHKKYGKAIKYYRKAIAINESASFHSNMGAAYFAKKDIPRAVAEYQRAVELDPDVLERLSNTGVAAQLSTPADRAHFSYILARMYAASGNLDRSLEYLRKAMEEGYTGIGEVYKDKEFAGLRKDPRFTSLMTSKPVAIPQ